LDTFYPKQQLFFAEISAKKGSNDSRVQGSVRKREKRQRTGFNKLREKSYSVSLETWDP
jgi:hypothetical protein